MATRRAPTATETAAAFGELEETATVIPGTRQLIAPETDDDTDEPEETPAERVARMIAQLRGDNGAVVKLYRIVNGAMEFCDDMTPEDFEAGGMLMIRKSWGPGAYQIRVIGNRTDRNGRPQRNILARDNFKIAPEPATASTPAQNSELSQVLALMAQQNQANALQLQAIMEKLAERPAAPDPMAQFQNMMGMLATARELFKSDAPPPAPQSSKSSLGEIVDAMRELRGVASEILPPPESDNPIMATIGPVLEIVKAGMERNAQAPALPAPQPFPAIQVPQTLAPIQQAPRVIRQPQQPQPQQGQQPMNIPEEFAPLIAVLDELLARATRGDDPAASAEYICDSLDDQALDLLEQPMWWALLSFQIPRVRPHQAWLTAARDAAIALLYADDSADDPATPGGEPRATGPVAGETDHAG